MTRIWDPYLTERDQAHLAAVWSKTTLRGFGTSPAVIVVDDYYSALGHVREPILTSIRTWPHSCGLEGWDAIDRTAELLGTARSAGVPVAYLHGIDEEPGPWALRGTGPSPFSHLPSEVRAKAYQIVDEVAPQPGDLVLAKTGASGFQGTPLQFHLNQLGVDTVIVVGETTSGCVRATVVDAATLRYKVGVVEECCFDRTEASHAINLFDMHHKYADVVDMATACAYLSKPAA